MYKLIAIDVDDTLLNSKREASHANLRAIKNAQAMGVKVSLCSGRPCSGMLNFLDEWGICDPIIGSGGAEIYEPETKSLLFHFPLQVDEARVILNWAADQQVHAQMYKGGNFIFARHSECVDLYSMYTRLKPLEDADFIKNMDSPTNKVLLIAGEERMKTIKRKALELFGDKYFITTSKPQFLEFMNPDATKGAALKRLTEYYGFSRDEVISVGDQHIDISMLEYSGLGIAVGNAVDDCKAAAGHIAPDCDHDAIAYVVEKFITGVL